MGTARSSGSPTGDGRLEAGRSPVGNLDPQPSLLLVRGARGWEQPRQQRRMNGTIRIVLVILVRLLLPVLSVHVHIVP